MITVINSNGFMFNNLCQILMVLSLISMLIINDLLNIKIIEIRGKFTKKLFEYKRIIKSFNIILIPLLLCFFIIILIHIINILLI